MISAKAIGPLMLAFALLVTSCAPAAQPGAQGQAPAARKGGVLRVSSIGGAPKLFHPYPKAEHHTGPHTNAWTLMGSGLIDFDYNTLDFWVDPDHSLARELPAVSNGGRTYTFTLRDGIHWSDRTPITTADFQFAWENARLEENDYVGLDDLEEIESYRTPDARTIEVTLTRPLARTKALGVVSLGPVPRHIWQGKPWYDPTGNPEILKPTVVAGPYLPKEIGAERHSFTRNGSYYGKQPNIDEVVFVAASPTTALELLRTKQAEWVEGYPPSQYAESKRMADVNVVEWTGATGAYRLIEFNLRKPFLSDKRFREALARTIDRRDLIQFEDDLAVPQYGFYTEGNTRWVNHNVERYDPDANRARGLLQEAGLRLDGSVLRGPDGQQVRLEILWPTTSVPRGKMATYLQQQWKQLGIDVVVTGLEFNAFVDRYSRQKDFDVVMGYLGGGSVDPDVVKSQIQTNGTQNAGGYSNPRVDELLQQGAVEQDERKRKEIYDELQRIVIADLPVYYMVTTKNFTAFDKKVLGVSPLKGGDILTQNNSQFIDWYIAQ